MKIAKNQASFPALAVARKIASNSPLKIGFSTYIMRIYIQSAITSINN